MRRRWMVLVGVLALAVPLVWALIRSVGGSVSAALWYVLWHANLVLKSVPQRAFWALFLCLALAGGIVSLRGERQAQMGDQESPAPRRGSIRQWAHAILRAGEASYPRWLLARQLSELILEAMDTGGQMAAGPRRQWWARNNADVPPGIRAYVEAALWGGFWPPSGVASRLSQALSPDNAVPPLDLELETVVRFLENQVEGGDEGRHP